MRPALYLLIAAFFFSQIARAQQSGPSDASAPPSLSTAPRFFDPPQFTVSGVTDSTSLGGHGSGALVRTKDSLAKDTAALKSEPAGLTDTRDLRQARERTQALLVQHDSAELHHELADLNEKLGDSLDSVREYQRAAEMNKTEPYLFDWGAELLLHRAPEPASEVFSNGNQAFPKSERMLLGLAAAWLARGSTDQAIACLSRASALNPSDPKPYLFLGKIQLTDRTPRSEVVEKLKQFVSLYPARADANYFYAVALWKQQRSPAQTALMESLLQNAIRLNPKYTAAHVQLGAVLAERHDFQKAISEYQKAIQSGPGPDGDADLQEAHYRLGQMYRQLGETQGAKAEIEIYQRMVKESEQLAAQERHDIPQFVYTMRDPPPAH